jgi:O-antigen/teichoic acid export membrane protein
VAVAQAPPQVGLFLALSTATAGNLAFHVVVGRGLGPADYGSLSALLTILLTLAVPAGAVQTVLTARIVRMRARGQHVDHRSLLRIFAGTGFAAAGVLSVAAPTIAGFLRLDGVAPVIVVAAFFVPALAGIVLRSVLLGHERYGLLGTVLVAGVALRVILGVAVVATGGGLVSALVATLASETATTIALAAACRQRCDTGAIPWQLRLRFGEVGGGVWAFSGLWLLIGADTILARHHLDPRQAGAYAAAALAARTVLFLPQAVVTAATPRFASEGRTARGALADALLLCLTLGLVTTVAILGVATGSLQRVFGVQYQIDAAVLAVLAGAAIWYCLLSCLTHFHLAQGDTRHAARPWIGVLLLTGTSLFIVDSPRALALAALLAGGVATVLTALPLLRVLTGEAPATGTRPVGAPTVELSVVVPFRDEGPRAAATIARLLDVAGREPRSLEVIAVSDGSTDGGDHLVADLDHASVVLVRKPVSEGKGAALRTGMGLARGRLIGFVDGDGDLDPLHVLHMARELEVFGADAVIGSKRHPRSAVRVPPGRRLLSLLTRVTVRLLAGATVADTQTGVKVFRRELLVDVLPRTRERGFLFDLELLILARARGWVHVVESPVVIHGLSRSAVRPGTVARSAIAVTRLVLRQGRPRPVSPAGRPVSVAAPQAVPA